MICPHCGGEIGGGMETAAAHRGVGTPEPGHPWAREWRAYDLALESLERKVEEVSELNRLLTL